MRLNSLIRLRDAATRIPRLLLAILTLLLMGGAPAWAADTTPGVNLREQMLEPEHATEVDGPKPGTDLLQKQASLISITPAPMPRRADIKRPDFFAKVRGNGFYVDGKRRFLLGAEGSATVYPYLYNLMGFDFVELGDFYHVTGFEKDGEGWRVWWGVNPYYAVEVDKMLDAGIMPYVALMERGNVERHPLFADFPRMFAERGHFLSFSPLNPTGEKIRWNNRKSVMAGLGDRPVWMWEMFNEVSYRCHDEANLDAFRRWAGEHYGDIARANAAWGTDFQDFASVVPPNPGYFVYAYKNQLPEGGSERLFFDFMRSQEEVFGRYGQRSLERMHELDPHGLVTVQSHANLSTGYGNIGVAPHLKALGEDVYGTEMMQHLYIQGAGENDPVELADMTMVPMTYDVVRAAAGDRPILNEECTLFGRGAPKLKARWMVTLDGAWRFFPLPADGSAAGDGPPSLDARGWATVEIPGTWGTQGYPDTEAGWLCRTFRLPEQSSMEEGEQLLLEGRFLANAATIYLNGKRVHATTPSVYRFSEDIGEAANWGGENVLAIRIENHDRRSGHYWGGIHGYVRVAARTPWHAQVMTPGQMRTYIWNMAAHGLGGSVMSYFYNNAGFRKYHLFDDDPNEWDHVYYSPFSPYYRSPEMLKTVAPTHKLINNLASIVLTPPQRGRVALVYPMTSLRATLPEGGNFYHGVNMLRFMRYYDALLFSQRPMDMVIDENLGDLSRYEAIVVAEAPLMTEEAMEKLEDYVRGGGVLMVANDSLTTNGDNYAPLGEVAWLPDRDVSGADQSGKAVGEGHVFMLPTYTLLPELQALIGTLMDRSGIDPVLTVRATGAEPASCVEVQNFIGDEGRTVWYLLNWGATCEAVVGSSAFDAGKTYRVRNAMARETIPSPTGQDVWTAEQLRRGIALTLPCQDPLPILIEESSITPLPLPGISAEHKARLDECFGPTIDSPDRILFNAAPSNARMTPVRIPTAVTAMEQQGWGVHTALVPISTEGTFDSWDGEEITQRALKDFQILVYACPQGNMRVPDRYIKVAKEFVANGGGLLLLANPPHGPHGWLSNARFVNPMAEQFGVKFVRYMAVDTQHPLRGHDVLPLLTNIADHPLTAGVESFDPDGTAWIQVREDSPATPVIRTNATSTPANEPVMVAGEYGKGRFVIMGSGYWLEPTIFDNADNRRLLRNIIQWLAPDHASAP